MKRRRSWLVFSVILVGLGRTASPLPAASALPTVDFNDQIRPILSEHCFKCHGPDEKKREGDLRLDVAANVFVDRGGYSIVVPGKSDESELYLRITSEDAQFRMPPESAGEPLSPEQTDLFRRWIDQAAEWEEHWSFVPPNRPPVPAAAFPARNAIDLFVQARLGREGLAPAPEADKATLVRRVSLDLVGLPPSLEQVEAFLADGRPDAYERLVDRLLASQAYGERWAQVWLDLARYADTQGYEKDNRRTIWRYRDWVIQAINEDMPFDQFTIEQLAGDLLPNATADQLIATAFHRNTMTNTEGGTDDEEFRTSAVVDRVNTTMQVWMGMTMGCGQCHSHKYDPISQREYYRFFAFFNNTEDADKNDEAPTLLTPTPRQAEQIGLVEAAIADAESRLNRQTPELDAAQAEWETQLLAKLAEDAPVLDVWHRIGPFEAAGGDEAFRADFDPETEIDLEKKYRDGKLAWVAQSAGSDGQIQKISGEKSATYFYRTIDSESGGPLALRLGSDDAIKLWLNGELVLAENVERAVAPDQDKITVRLKAGENQLLVKVVNYAGDSGFYFQSPGVPLPKPALSILRVAADQRTAEQNADLAAYYRSIAPALDPARAMVAELRKQLDAIQPPTTPIFRELPPDQRRETHVHVRGNFLDKGEAVEPGTPAIFNPMPEGAPHNRLGMARWLVDHRNPLTARVVVNRLWEQLFGTGLVQTSEDFGTQGEPPSHPALLDWLASELMRRDWSLKSTLRLIVTSATYRQSSECSPEFQSKDPYNRLLARGPRFRLKAEMIRDQALAVSGLLSAKLYGESVMPPQPEGIWQVVYSNDTWKTSQGADRYRRGVYTFWRRTSPYPAMTTFDAPSREFCVVRRMRTNTPLQALITLNDEVYIEAAQALARRMMAEAGPSPNERAAYGVRLCVAREAKPDEVRRLIELYESELAHFRGRPEAARQLATVPLGAAPPDRDLAELAAWTVVGNVLLNLDETLTKG